MQITYIRGTISWSSGKERGERLCEYSIFILILVMCCALQCKPFVFMWYFCHFFLWCELTHNINIIFIFQWKVDSAAIIDYHVGKNPDNRTIKTLNKNGITSYTHKVRQVSSSVNDKLELKHTNLYKPSFKTKTSFSILISAARPLLAYCS